MMFPRNRGLPTGISLLRQLNAQADAQTLNLGLGKPEEDMPESLRALAISTLKDTSLEYTENAGDWSLREKLAQKFRVSAGSRMVLTHGAQEGIMAAFMAVLNPGDEVLVPDPGFLAYAPMAKMVGAKSVFYTLPLKNGKYDHAISEVKKKISARTRLIVLSSPGNPTGAELSEAFTQELFRLIEKKKIVIVSDEVYGMLHFKKPYVPMSTLSDRVISISSFSKSHALTGWRIGFLTTENEALQQACLISHQYLATCASVPAQRLVSAMLETKLFESVPDFYRKHYQEKLQLFRNSSGEGLRENTPEACGGFYLFPKLSVTKWNPKKDSMIFCARVLKEKNLLAIPGIAFGKKGEGSIRLSLAISDEKIKKAAAILSIYYE